MKLNLPKFYLGQVVKRFFRFLRSPFNSTSNNFKIACLAKPDSQIKLNELMIRLKFFWPDIKSEQVKLISGLPCKELLTGVVLLLDQELVSKKWIRTFDNIFNVDFEKNAVDGWQMCAIAEYIAGLPRTTRVHEAKDRFLAFIQRIKIEKHAKTYVFGTGLSLDHAGNHDFNDGYRVVCNTIVRDPILWHHLKPHIFVAGDAIYHFGFTEFACAFRSDLRERLRESDGSVLFVYPALFDAIVQREFSEFSNILVPIPFGAHDYVEVNLCEDFALPALGNVLNNLLLPVACTLTKSVYLWGFDGRAPTDKLFWSNSNKHSYPELMPHLIKAHPAFYETLVPKNNESNYVKAVHGDELERRLQRAELHGYEFVMMHKSWTETLQRRFHVDK
ncbi:hypothetical protein [Polaromonas sp.]|uniref:hypothetical protein n=1 Tax=Polaromonas sp. TaxID=1869339 RepID=UPI003BB54BCB